MGFGTPNPPCTSRLRNQTGWKYSIWVGLEATLYKHISYGPGGDLSRYTTKLPRRPLHCDNRAWQSSPPSHQAMQKWDDLQLDSCHRLGSEDEVGIHYVLFHAGVCQSRNRQINVLDWLFCSFEIWSSNSWWTVTAFFLWLGYQKTIWD